MRLRTGQLNALRLRLHRKQMRAVCPVLAARLARIADRIALTQAKEVLP